MKYDTPDLPLLLTLALLAGPLANSISAAEKRTTAASVKPKTVELQVYYDAQGKPVRNYVWSQRRGKPLFVANSGADATKPAGPTPSKDGEKSIDAKPVPAYSLPASYIKLLSRDSKGNLVTPELVRFTPQNSYRNRRYISLLNYYSPYGGGYSYHYGYGRGYGTSYYPSYYRSRYSSYPSYGNRSYCRPSGSIFGRAGSVGFRFRY